MSKKHVFIERRDQGDYAVRLGDAKRASAVAPTQKEAIKLAREMHPEIAPVVERVRSTSVGAPDKWRKA